MAPGWLPWKTKGQASSKPKELTTTASSQKSFPSGLKLLHEGKDCVVDIIFIHGLTGDRERTWRAKTATAPWPQTLLPQKVPNARILTFGYDAYVADWKGGVVSKNRIGNHSMNLITGISTYRETDGTSGRPIIFICHSLGGLVCEDALVVSQQRVEKHLQDIFLATYGIIFMGTPHNGSGLAQWGKKLAKSIAILKQMNPQIIAVLESDSEMLSRIQGNFHAMIRSQYQESSRPLQITCFYEELPLPGIGVVVPFHSAIIPGYTPIGIHANHKDMTRFDKLDDSGFVAVVGELVRWIKEMTLSTKDELSGTSLANLSPSTSQKTNISYITDSTGAGLPANFFGVVQRRSVSHYVTRTNVQKELDSWLFGPPPKQPLVLYGIGGAGKTQLAIQCCHKAEEDGFVATLWIDASSPETIEQSYNIIGRTISKEVIDNDDIQATISLVQNTIRRWLHPWLMVFDNYDNPKKFQKKRIKDYIPNGKGGYILFTSRHSSLTSLASHRIPVSEMSQAESVDLLLQRLPIDLNEETEAKNIARSLGNLPLALDQAGAYIRARNLVLADFSIHYRKRKETIFKEVPDDWEYYNEKGPLSVFTTWEMSFDLFIGDSMQAVWKSDFLTVAAFFDCTKISERYFHAFAKVSDSEWLNLFRTDGEWDGYKLGDVIAELCKLSLIQLPDQDAGEQSFTIHPIVRDWMIYRDKKAMRQWAALELKNILVAFFNEPGVEETSIQANQETSLHLDICISHDREYVDGSDKASVRNDSVAASAFARFYRKQGRYQESEALLRLALAANEKAKGTDHRDTLMAVESLAVICHRRGDYSEAEALFGQALKGTEKKLGPDHIDTLRIVQYLANVYSEQGRYAEAEQLLDRVLTGMLAELGSQDMEYLGVGQNLANLYRKMGRHREAQSLYERALAGKQKQLGPDHLVTLGVVENLANTYRLQGRLNDAEALFKRSLAGVKKKLGPEHPDTLRAVLNLANVYSDKEEFDKAKQLYLTALLGNTKRLGADHPNTLRTVENLASLHTKQGSYVDAERLFQRALVGNTKRKGAEHPDTLNTLENLGILYYKIDKFDEAGDIFEEVLKEKERNHGGGHPDISSTLKSLGNVYFKQGRLEDAEKVYVRALYGVEKTEQQDTVSAMQNLAAVFVQQGRLKEASQLRRRLLDNKKPDDDLKKGKKAHNRTDSALGGRGTTSGQIIDTPVIGRLSVEIVRARDMVPSVLPRVTCEFQGAEVVTGRPVDDNNEETSFRSYMPSRGGLSIGRHSGSSGTALGRSATGTFDGFYTDPSWRHCVTFEVFAEDAEIVLRVHDYADGKRLIGQMKYRPDLFQESFYSHQDWFPLNSLESESHRTLSGQIMVQLSYQNIRGNKVYGFPDFKISGLTDMDYQADGQRAKTQVTTSCSYAIRGVPKKYLNGQVDSTIPETAGGTDRRLLLYTLSPNHSPFLNHPKVTYQTLDELHVVANFKIGGELFLQLRNRGRFDERQVKIYVAEIVSALDYLHARNIIYGILEYSSLLLDSHGHISLCNFGISVIRSDNKEDGGCGEYSAPETIASSVPFTKASDCWSLGTLIFELANGWSPFYDERTAQMIQNICFGKVDFQLSTLSEVARDFIRCLLEKNPAKRLGGSFGAMELKQHPFLSNIDWDAVDAKVLIPPVIPDITDSEMDATDTDKSNDTGGNYSTSKIGQTMPSTLGMQTNFKGFTFVDSGSVPIDIRKKGT